MDSLKCFLTSQKIKSLKLLLQKSILGLSQRVNDPTNTFLGYWDAQQWVNETYGIDIKYQRIREYLKQHFKTKLKSPRKSHYKKNVEAEKAFLKTT
jgi:transposase